MHNQVAGTLSEYLASGKEAFAGAVIGDDRVADYEIDRCASASGASIIAFVGVHHDRSAGAGGLIAAEGGIGNLEGIVQREDRAAGIGAVVGSASEIMIAAYTPGYVVIRKGAVSNDYRAVMVKDGTAQRSAAARICSGRIAAELPPMTRADVDRDVFNHTATPAAETTGAAR